MTEHLLELETLDELPIGPGKGPERGGPAEAPEGDGQTPAPLEEEAPALPPELAQLEQEAELARLAGVQWEPRRLKKPLQVLVGRTVNWRIKARLGVDTDAGLMSDEHAIAIAEPTCEILNRHDGLRALAEKAVEIELMVAIYDYVQETAHRAGQAAYRAKQVEPPRRAAAPPTPFDHHVPPVMPVERTYDEGDDEL